MNDLIRERDERTRRRKKFKKKMDDLIGLSYHDEEKHAMSMSVSIAELSDKTIRLLDEGFIDNGFVIKKGTMEKYLNGDNQYVRGWENVEGEWEQTEVLNLTADFVGTVNLGHMDFATFPFIIGEWNKSDLSLVDIGNDRKGIDVDLRLDEDSVFVREIKRQPYDIGVSAEFWYHVNDEDTTSLSEMLGYYMPVIDEIFIFAYGLVGECGNVNSSGLELKKGDSNMSEIVKNKEIELEAEIAETPTDEPMETSAEEVTEEAEVAEEAVEAEGEDTVDPVDSDDSEEAEDDGEEAEAEDDEEADGDEAEEEEAEDEEADEAEESYSNVEAYIHSLEDEVKALRSENAELKKMKRRSDKKLKREKEEKEAFVSKFRSVVEGMGEEKPVEKEKSSNYISGDGIGE